MQTLQTRLGKAQFELERVSFTYPGNDSPALTDVSLSVSSGEFVVFAGANGSGKSTMARILKGLLIPDSGIVKIDGVQCNSESRDPFVQVGLIFQNPEDQLVSFSVAEDVAFGLENLGISRSQMAVQVAEALTTMDIPDLYHRSPHTLSPGQQQKTALAGALAAQPRCLIIDEGTAMLDPGSRKEFIRVLKKLNSYGISIILITHHPEEIIISDRCVLFEGGRIIADSQPASLFQGELTRRWKYGSLFPYYLADKLSTDIPKELDPWKGILQILKDRFSLKGRSMENVSMDGLFQEPALFSSSFDRSQSQNGDNGVVLQDVSFRLPQSKGGATLLDRVSASFYEGEVTSLIGRAGAGKSTLLHHLNGLFLPTEGSASYFGRTLQKKEKFPLELRRQIGLVMQQPEHQLFASSVAEDVAYGPRNLGLTGKTLRSRVVKAMSAVGLDYKFYAPRSIRSLSGGEKRRAAIAGVLAMEPRLLLLDEPTAGLDPEQKRSFWELLKTLRNEGRGIVLVTHDMNEVYELSDRVVLVHDGKAAYQGRPADFFQSEIFDSFYGDEELPGVLRTANLLREAGYCLPAEWLGKSPGIDIFTDQLKNAAATGGGTK